MAETRRPLPASEKQESLKISQGSQEEGEPDKNPAQGLPGPVPSVPNQPPSYSHKHQGRRKKNNCLDITRFIVEVLTLGVLLCYTIITNRLWVVADKANRLNAENVRLDQRAWIGISGLMQLSLNEGELPTITIPVQNSGKTPATKVKFNVRAKAAPREDGFIPEYQTLPGILPHEGSVTILYPNAQMPIKTEFPSRSVTHQDMLDIEEGRIILWVWGKVSYEDIFGCSHLFTFCGFYKPAQKFIDACQTYNEIDSNNESDCRNTENKK